MPASLSSTYSSKLPASFSLRRISLYQIANKSVFYRYESGRATLPTSVRLVIASYGALRQYLKNKLHWTNISQYKTSSALLDYYEKGSSLLSPAETSSSIKCHLGANLSSYPAASMDSDRAQINTHPPPSSTRISLASPTGDNEDFSAPWTGVKNSMSLASRDILKNPSLKICVKPKITASAEVEETFPSQDSLNTSTRHAEPCQSAEWSKGYEVLKSGGTSKQNEFQLFRFLELAAKDDIKEQKLNVLYEAARLLFTGESKTIPEPVAIGLQGFYGPTFKSVLALRHFLESLTLQDLGLDLRTVFYNYQLCLHEQKRIGSRQVASCWNIKSSPGVCIALFLLPKGCPLRLHRHPGMIVLSKVMLGKLKATVVSALSPEMDDLQTCDRDVEFRDPGLTLLPTEEGIMDFGAVPTTTCKTELLTNLVNSTRYSECSAVRRRMVLGSRLLRPVDDTFEAVELFSGVVESKGDFLCHPPLQKCSIDTVLPSSQEGGVEWANLMPNEMYETTLVCTPCIGNLHRFEAVTDFVLVLDVISPSYEVPFSRQCQYYARSRHKSLELSPLRVGKEVYRRFSVSPISEVSAGPDVFLELQLEVPS